MKSNPAVKKAIWILLPFLVIAGCVGLAFLYLRFVPSFPCVFNAAFHLYCPGCGMTRAVSALLKGDVLLCLRENALLPFLLLIPFLYYLEALFSVFGHPVRFPFLHSMKSLYILLGVIVVFAILRNLIPALAPI